ncbi:A24 family peptidase [Sphingomonas sp. LY160]|uniref:A24 family peptidase n=1 Tax=Sphingomonas sp. LY160 TaxID=3095342 RepID=UPI002ADEDF25|nr:prepilin peptidase [Sphingomonas sp. LY160]MEA1072518.1 prepilin peptidase [Sphingomonas sp. LY160]
MNLAALAPAWLAIFLLLVMAASAVEDIWRMEIEDWLSGAVAAGAIVAAIAAGPTLGLWQNTLLALSVLAVGWWLFVRGAMGGGDVKLLTAAALWFDLSSGWKMLVAVAVVGGLVTIVMIAVRHLPWPATARTRVVSLRRDEGIPYGVAIAAGVGLSLSMLR